MIADSTCVIILTACGLEKHALRTISLIVLDKAYNCEQIRVFLAKHGAVAGIPDKAKFRIKHDFDSQI